jgi:hypothetical protein
VDGTSPVKALSCAENDIRLEIEPNEEGREPIRLLFDTSNVLTLTSEE